MELIECLAQLLKTENLQTQQMAALASANSITAAYIAAFLFLRTKDSAVALCAYFACVVVSYSSIYDYVNEWQLMLLYCLIDSIACKCLSSLSARIAYAIMLLFSITMAADAGYNATVETWLHSSYSHITQYIHCIVIASLFDWRAVVDMGRITNHVKRFTVWVRGFLRYGRG